MQVRTGVRARGIEGDARGRSGAFPERVGRGGPGGARASGPGPSLADPDGPSRHHVRLLGLRPRRGPLARAVPGLRGVEHARRGARPPPRAARAAAPAARGGVAPAPGAAARGPRGAHAAARRPASASSTGCSAAAWCPGSLVLLGGSPGIGKSTLTGMALGHLVGRRAARRCTSAARSRAAQIRLRHERLARGAAPAALDVPVLAETDLDAVLAALEAERPEACVIDSVQTLHASELSGAPGSVGQVREVAARIMARGQALGHRRRARRPRHEGGRARRARASSSTSSTASLQFEGERERTYRTLRALKNRFGSTNEVGVFEMRDGGLVEVLDASARFVARGDARARQRGARLDGGLAAAARRGPGARLASELVPPRRVATGIDRNRLALVLAVLGRHAGRRRGDGRRVRQRRRRRARRRAGRRPRRRARRRRAPRAGAPAGGDGGAAGVLRRGRPDRRAALGRPPRPPRRGGREVRPAHGRDPGVRADAAPGRPRGAGPGARAGARPAAA